MVTKLDADAIKAALAETPEWSEVSGAIQRTFQFEDFARAMAFVHKVADYAEDAQHHPDILIRYNKVTISVSTHDAGGISEKDFALAKAVDRFADPRDDA